MDHGIVPTYYDHHYQISKVKSKKKGKEKEKEKKKKRRMFAQI